MCVHLAVCKVTMSRKKCTGWKRKGILTSSAVIKYLALTDSYHASMETKLWGHTPFKSMRGTVICFPTQLLGVLVFFFKKRFQRVLYNVILLEGWDPYGFCPRKGTLYPCCSLTARHTGQLTSLPFKGFFLIGWVRWPRFQLENFQIWYLQYFTVTS